MEMKSYISPKGCMYLGLNRAKKPNMHVNRDFSCIVASVRKHYAGISVAHAVTITLDGLARMWKQKYGISVFVPKRVENDVMWFLMETQDTDYVLEDDFEF